MFVTSAFLRLWFFVQGKKRSDRADMVADDVSGTKYNGQISVIDMEKKENDKKFESDKKTVKKGVIPYRMYLVVFCAEFLGTALLMFLGCMGGLTAFDDVKPNHHFGGICFGLTVMLIIQLFGHVSGAHLNPAVTIAAVILKMLTPMMGVVFVVAQFLGGIAGYGLLKLLASSEYIIEGYCVTKLNDKITAVQGLAIEIVISTVLILLCCAVWDKRNKHNTDSTPLRFGFAIAVISMTAGPITGASMNTARSFAPLVFGGSWQDHWIYWVAPNLAAVLACGIYKFLFDAPEDEKSSTDETVRLDDISAQIGEKV